MTLNQIRNTFLLILFVVIYILCIWLIMYFITRKPEVNRAIIDNVIENAVNNVEFFDGNIKFIVDRKDRELSYELTFDNNNNLFDTSKAFYEYDNSKKIISDVTDGYLYLFDGAEWYMNKQELNIIDPNELLVDPIKKLTEFDLPTVRTCFYVNKYCYYFDNGSEKYEITVEENLPVFVINDSARIRLEYFEGDSLSIPEAATEVTNDELVSHL